MTAARVILFYKRSIAPRVQEDGCVLVVAHGNSLCSLLVHLDQLGPGVIDDVNIATGEILLYRMAPNGRMLNRTAVLAAMPWQAERLAPVQPL